MPQSPDRTKRFWSKVRKTPTCWLWTASLDRYGYGVFSLGRGKNERAHRYSYKAFYGFVPRGKLVLHRCDNPKCVNPAHLFAGTNRDNTRDMMAKGRHKSQTDVGF